MIIRKRQLRMNKIKYDKRDNNIIFWIAIIFSIIAIISVVLARLDYILDKMFTELVVLILLFGSIFSPVIAVASWLLFFDSYFYLKRLQKYGYVIPVNKRKYEGNLEKLLRNEEKNIIHSSVSKESIMLARLTLGCAIVILVINMHFLQKYIVLEDSAWFLFGVMILVSLFWLIGACFYWRQRLNITYKDDVELDNSRKTRRHLMEGLITIIVCLCITLYFIKMCYGVADYIYSNRL